MLHHLLRVQPHTLLHFPLISPNILPFLSTGPSWLQLCQGTFPVSRVTDALAVPLSPSDSKGRPYKIFTICLTNSWVPSQAKDGSSLENLHSSILHDTNVSVSTPCVVQMGLSSKIPMLYPSFSASSMTRTLVVLYTEGLGDSRSVNLCQSLLASIELVDNRVTGWTVKLSHSERWKGKSDPKEVTGERLTWIGL